MIYYLRGKIVHTKTDYTVIDVQGVGYQVYCANPFQFAVRDDEVTVYIHQHVREDSVQLFGFSTMEEQSLFKRLLDVSGIGPRVALGMLSGAKPEAVVTAIQQENIGFLTKLPGIGKKTAQRMVLDLKDKLGTLEQWNIGAEAAAAGGTVNETALPDDDVWSEAKEALKSLGYTEAEADGALRKVRANAEEEASVDVIMRLALQTLFKP